MTHTRKINTRRRSARTPKAALPYSAIERALPRYGAGLADLRAKALVTVAFSTLLRRSELVALEVADFKPTPDAADGTVRVRSSKVDRAGHGAERYVSAEARRHLEAWLDAAGIHEGAVFVRLNRNGAPLAKALHANQVALIVKDVARRAGFKKREIKTIAAHSTRIGATHALAEAGTDVLQVHRMAAGNRRKCRQFTCVGRRPGRGVWRSGFERARRGEHDAAWRFGGAEEEVFCAAESLKRAGLA